MADKLADKATEITNQAYNVIPEGIKNHRVFKFLEKELGSSVFKNILMFVFIVALIYIMYTIYQKIYTAQKNAPYIYKIKGNTKVLGPIKADDSSDPGTVFPSDLLDSSNGSYSISIWLWISSFGNVDETNPNKISTSESSFYRHVLHKGDNVFSTSQPGIWLHPTKNELLICYDNDTSGYEYDYLGEKEYSDANDRQFKGKALEYVKRQCSADQACKGFNVVTENPLNDDSEVLYAGFASTSGDSSIRDVTSNNCAGGKCSGLFMKKDHSTINDGRGNMNPNVNSSIVTNRDISTIISDVPINSWFNITITAFNNVMEIYLDGHLRDTIVSSSMLKNNNGDIYVTQKLTGDEGGNSFHGYWTHSRYFNKALTQSEINDLYNKGPSPFILPDITGDFNKVKNYAAHALNIENGVKIGKHRITTQSILNQIRGTD